MRQNAQASILPSSESLIAELTMHRCIELERWIERDRCTHHAKLPSVTLLPTSSFCAKRSGVAESTARRKRMGAYAIVTQDPRTVVTQDSGNPHRNDG